MRQYEKYKSSGIEWLGDIPEHWIIQRIKNVSKIVNGSTPKSNIEEYWDGEIIWITPSDISKLNGTISDSEKKITLEGYRSCGTELVPVGSTIITCRAPIGNTVLARKELCTNQGCKSLIPNFIDERFLYYFIVNANDELNSLGQGTTFLELSRTSLGNTNISIPIRINEQTAIATYLYQKTTKLDQLIKNKKAQIDKLKEIRQIEINNAVTKGLDPNAKLKPSGIEWLGVIPEHWEVKRLKDKVIVNKSSLGSETDLELEIKYLDISNVNNTGLTGEIQELIFFEAPSRARRIVENGDVVMSTVRPYLKAITYLENIPENMIASTGFAVMTSKSNYVSKFLFYQTVSDWFNETINSKSVGASYPALNNDVLIATNILVPPKDEQTAIANYLDKKTIKIDHLIKNIENQIEQLKEIRKIEIYNAVTGKIKVI
jgi:type I restriction enzyme, S subunit